MLVIATAVPAVISIKNSIIDAQDTGHPFMGRSLPSTIPDIESFDNNWIHAKNQGCPLKSILGDWNWLEIQKITIPNAKIIYFGNDVAIDGDTALIGAPYDDGLNGSVYVYTRTDANWTQQQILVPSDPGVDDCFGVYVALQGDTAIIGASDEASMDSAGAAYVFTRTEGTWTEQQKIIPINGDPLDWFCTVDLDGDTAIIGALGDDDMGVDAGALYVFTRTDTTWTQQAKLFAADAMAGGKFGRAVSLDGDTALTSTFTWWNDTVPGAAYVFTRTGTTWTQQAKLIGSDTAVGDSFGLAIALDGDTALVGAPNDGDQGAYSGSAYVFTRTDTIWTQEAKLLHLFGTSADWLGCSISLEGDTALIGAANEEEGSVDARGAAYVFTRIGTTWTEKQRIISSDGEFSDNFGWPVRLDGDTAFIGTFIYAPIGFNSGSVYVFAKSVADLTFSITGGLGIKAEITNNGTSDANDIPWQIHVEGGILGKIYKTVNGTVDINAGESQTVSTGMLLGLGGITISARVADVEKTATGSQLIIFSMVKT